MESLKDKKNLKSIWRGIIYRTTSPNCKAYKNYMGRGITISQEWLNFENFYQDMKDGFKPGLSVDRIDVNGNYCRENCKWATAQEQAINRRSTVFFEYRGEKLYLREASKKYGIRERVISDRIRLGWTIDEIFNIPVKKLSRKALGFC